MGVKVASSGSAKRGLAPVLAFVLLVGIVAVASVGLLLVAGDALDESEQRAKADQAEQSFLQLSKDVETVAISDGSSRSVDLAVGDGGGSVERVEDGTFDVLVGNDSIFHDGTGPAPIDLHAIEFTGADGKTLAYQGGAVWRGSGNRTSMVSSPDVGLSDGTLSVPVQVLDDDGVGLSGNAISISSTGSTSTYSGLVINSENITINVTSRYYRGWARYFESMEGAQVDVVDAAGYPDAKTVVVTFETAEEVIDFSDIGEDFRSVLEIDGLVATSSGGKIDGNVTVTQDAHINVPGEGNLFVGGDAFFSGSADRYDGNVVAGGVVEVASTQVFGDVIAGGAVDFQNGRVDDAVSYDSITFGGHGANELISTGEIDASSHICNPPGGCYDYQDPADIDRHPDDYADRFVEHEPIDDAIDQLVAAGDEAGASWDTLNETTIDESGVYYVDSIELDSGDPGKSLLFDVADGDITVVVRGDVQLDAGYIRVENADQGTVRIFLAGDYSSTTAHICPLSEGFGCPNHNSLGSSDGHTIQMYGKSTSKFRFDGQTNFHGVIYAPPSTPGDETIELQGTGGMVFYGAIVAGRFETSGQTNLVYDDDLLTAYERPTDPRYDPDELNNQSESGHGVEYLHVTTHELVVESG